jgi:hypothetical protein
VHRQTHCRGNLEVPPRIDLAAHFSHPVGVGSCRRRFKRGSGKRGSQVSGMGFRWPRHADAAAVGPGRRRGLEQRSLSAVITASSRGALGRPPVRSSSVPGIQVFTWGVFGRFHFSVPDLRPGWVLRKHSARRPRVRDTTLHGAILRVAPRGKWFKYSC